MNIVEIIRGLVRPIVSLIVVLALVGVVIYLIVKFADLELAKIFAAAFLGLIGPIVGFWFGTRKSSAGG